MKKLDILAAVLVAVGGLNWGLVAVAKFDLVAALVGLDFGQTNAASRVVYGLVGSVSRLPGRPAARDSPALEPRPTRRNRVSPHPHTKENKMPDTIARPKKPLGLALAGIAAAVAALIA